MTIRKLLLLIAAFSGLSAMAEDITTDLVVWSKDGTKVSYKLNDSPKITFTDDCLVIMANNAEVSYELSQMARLTYEHADVDGIIDVNGEKVNPFNFNGESLLFPASDADATVRIYATDGKVVIDRTVPKGETLALPLHSLSKGIYIVKANSVTYKIVKR